MFCRRRIASADVSGATTSEPSGRSSTTTYSPERSPLSVTCSVRSVAMPQVWHGYRNELSGWKPGGSLWRRQTVLDRRPTIKKEPENKASTAIGPASTLPCPDLSRRRSPVRIRLGVLRNACTDAQFLNDMVDLNASPPCRATVTSNAPQLSMIALWRPGSRWSQCATRGITRAGPAMAPPSEQLSVPTQRLDIDEWPSAPPAQGMKS